MGTILEVPAGEEVSTGEDASIDKGASVEKEVSAGIEASTLAGHQRSAKYMRDMSAGGED